MAESLATQHIFLSQLQEQIDLEVGLQGTTGIGVQRLRRMGLEVLGRGKKRWLER